jgi:hypothetical protein
VDWYVASNTYGATMSSKKNPAKKTPAKKNATKARAKRPEAAPEQTTQPEQTAAPVEQATNQAPMEQAPEVDTAANAEKPEAKGRPKKEKPARGASIGPAGLPSGKERRVDRAGEGTGLKKCAFDATSEISCFRCPERVQ